MSDRQPFSPPAARWLFIGAGVIAAVVSGITAIAEVAPNSDLAQGVARILPVAQPNLDYAEAVSSDPRRAAELPKAASAARAAAAVAPDRLRATLVELDVGVANNSRRFDAPTLALLDRSYRLSPLDFTYGPGRVAFAYNHWGQLTPALRARVYRETDCLDAAAHIQLVEAAPRIRDRLGSLAYVLNVRRAERGKGRCIPPY